MALTTCPDCARRTSDRAGICVYCGYNLNPPDEFRTRRRPKVPRKPLNWVLGSILVGLVLYMYFVKEAGFVYTDSGSMLPAIRPGDRMFVSGLGGEVPERGQIINFRFRENGTVYYIKRVIALPGDDVEVSDGRLYLDGRLLYEPYLYEERMDYSFEEQTVPEDHLFVLGDNRNNSFDSADWGFLPLEDALAEVLLVYWPRFKLLE